VNLGLQWYLSVLVSRQVQQHRSWVSQVASQRWATHAAAVKKHLAEWERGVRHRAEIQARMDANDAAMAAALVELAKVVGRAQAATLTGVDIRVVNRAYKTVRAGVVTAEA
jgi:hypothetical protein